MAETPSTAKFNVVESQNGGFGIVDDLGNVWPLFAVSPVGKIVAFGGTEGFAFTATTGTDWDAVQTTIAGALDELASRVKTLEGAGE